LSRKAADLTERRARASSADWKRNWSTLGTGGPPRSSSSSKKWISTSAGTTRSGSRSPLALSALSNTDKVSDLRH